MKRILHAILLVGTSSALTVALGALRHKLIAVEVGVAGIGAIGVLTSIVNLAVVVCGLGLGTSGVQAIAASHTAAGDRLITTRTALLRGGRSLAGVGGIVVAVIGAAWVAVSGAENIFYVAVFAVSLSVAAMVMSASQLAYLNGVGLIRAMAVSNGVGAILGTAVTVVVIGIAPELGVFTAIAAPPIGIAICSTIATHRHRLAGNIPTRREWVRELRSMINVGGAVMAGLLVTAGTQMILRFVVESNGGLTAVGHFQAVWTITSLYIGFLLTALAAEYFPRISRLSSQDRLNASVNAQIQIALAVAGPVLLATILFAPFVLSVLYSDDFSDGAELLRLQLVGDVFKVVAWAIAFLLLARKARGAFFLGELAFNVVYLATAIVLPPRGDLANLGYAYIVAYALYLVLMLIFANRETGFRPTRETSIVGGVTLFLSLTVMVLVKEGLTATTVVAVSLSFLGLASALFTLRRVRGSISALTATEKDNDGSTTE